MGCGRHPSRMLILLLSLVAARKQQETLGSDRNINQMLLNTLTSALGKSAPGPGLCAALAAAGAESEGRRVELGPSLVPEAIRESPFLLWVLKQFLEGNVSSFILCEQF